MAQARALLEEVVAEAPPGGRRAQALTRLGWVCTQEEGFRPRPTSSSPPWRSLPTTSACASRSPGGGLVPASTRSVPAAKEHARAALELAEELGEPDVLAGALAYVAFLDSLGGEGVATPTIERALALESPPWSQIPGRPDWIHALLLVWAASSTFARERSRRCAGRRSSRGDEHSLSFVLFQLARVELPARRLDGARSATRGMPGGERGNGQVGERPYALTIKALVEAHLGARRGPGETERALRSRTASASCRRPRAAGDPRLPPAFARGCRGRRAHARPRWPRPTERGLREPALFRFHGDAIEAKVALGRRDEAGGAARRAERARSDPRAGLAADDRGSRSRPARAAHGELERGRRRARAALALHDRLGEPFERARTLLVLGNVQRRARKKRTARESLQAALAAFEAARRDALGGRDARGAGADRGPGACDCEADADRGARGRAARRRPDVPAGCRRALRQPQDRAVEPLEDLPQARHRHAEPS